MEKLDPYRFQNEKERTKAVGFVDFVLGHDGGLSGDALEAANLGCFDMRYRVLEKGTVVYTRKFSTKHVAVFAIDVDTLFRVLRSQIREWKESEGVECFVAYKTTEDVHVMEVYEDSAQEICQLWCQSPEKDGMEEKQAEARDKEAYEKLLARSDLRKKNLLDSCLTLLAAEHARGLLYRLPGESYGVLVSNDPMGTNYVQQYQSIVVPRRAVESLSLDRDGYLALCGPRRTQSKVPSKAVPHVNTAVPKADAPKPNNAADTEEEAVLLYDEAAIAAERYEEIANEDGFDDYASIRFVPQESPTKIQSPRPGQPPPPPPSAGVEPLYSIVDKNPLKRHPHVESLDPQDSPDGAAKPPRPPPLDTMPSTDAGSSPLPAVQASGTPKPSRPSAPPKRKPSQDLGNFGSSGNVSLDGKDEDLTPPPRHSAKSKGKAKEVTKF